MNLKLVSARLGKRDTISNMMDRGYRYSVARRETSKALRVYLSPKGESVGENLFFGRHNRPHEQLRALVEKAMFRAGLKPSDATHIKWSQKAGCRCGCSPGFIVQGYAFTGQTVFASYIDADHKPVLPGVRKTSKKATKK